MKLPLFFELPLFRGWGRNSLKKIVGFFVQTMTPKSPFEITWSLVNCKLPNWPKSDQISDSVSWTQNFVRMTLINRRLVWSTDQAYSSGFYFRIPWKSTKQPCFLHNHSLSFLQGIRSFKNWLLQKLSMKSLDQKF